MTSTTDTYDVVVIGAGLAGALVAYQLAREGFQVAVLEATDAPGGIARRGVGLAILGTPEPFTHLQERLGTETAEVIWAHTQENLDLLAATLQETGQEARRVGSLRATDDDDVAQQLRESAILLQQAGYDVELADATVWGYQAALCALDDLLFDIEALIPALLAHPHITLAHSAEVYAIKQRAETGPGGAPLLSIWARHQYLMAGGVVLAGGAHAVQLSRSLGSIAHPRQLQSVDLTTEAELTAPLILHQVPAIVHQSAAGHWRMVSWASEFGSALENLTAVARQLCPEARVKTRHSGWVAQSRDGFPFVGALPDLPGVYTINGLGAWGMSWAFVAAQRLVAQMLRDEPPGFLNLDRLFAH